MIRIAPSILSANFAKLGEDIQDVVQAGADWIHVDVMDGHFVPNLTFGPPVIAALRQTTTIPLDVHLMVAQPDVLLHEYCQAGSDLITVHWEACTHIHRTIYRIKEQGIKAGLAMNPGTPITLVESLLADLDLLLIMTVNPGFGGQSFIPSTLEKIRIARAWADERHPSLHIEVDGGINHETAQLVKAAGADVLVAGHAVFRQANRGAAIEQLRNG